MPNNFRHIGLIHLMLPNARIIDARREPMACCFSNFKQLFASGQQFTYSIEDIARYYRIYVELMAHWDAVLPGKVLRVQHEDVVDDLEASVRRILDFCGLDFEPACIEFHKTRRPCTPPAPSRSVSRSTATESINGGISSPGWRLCRPPSDLWNTEHESRTRKPSRPRYRRLTRTRSRHRFGFGRRGRCRHRRRAQCGAPE